MRAAWWRGSREPERVVGLATVAAGPFHDVEAEFRAVPGVLETSVGYTGGARPNPSYQQVAAGRTGHVEAVRIEFDPRRVFYAELLDTFWRLHDPIQPALERRHRSVVFAHSRDQERVAYASLLAAQAAHGRQLLTQIARAGDFYRAEDEHQHVLERHGLAVALQ
jgi:peptide-methionine (S)-S-oxide reductase